MFQIKNLSKICIDILEDIIYLGIKVVTIYKMLNRIMSFYLDFILCKIKSRELHEQKGLIQETKTKGTNHGTT